MNPEESTTVLLVEDSEEDFLIVKRAFKKAGMKNEIFRISTGDDAVDYLQNTGKYTDKESYPKPALVLLDLNLPGLNGREVLQSIKNNENTKKIPVIILTTSSDDRDIDECYQYGANSYMQKPVSFSGFVEAIARLKDYWFEISILPKKI